VAETVGGIATVEEVEVVSPDLTKSHNDRLKSRGKVLKGMALAGSFQ
jgi:hypothetical protein